MTATPKPGTRVRLLHDEDRYPHFIAPRGATGVVVDTGAPEVFAVRLDHHLHGAEEWDNEVHWYDVDDAFGHVVHVAPMLLVPTVGMVGYGVADPCGGDFLSDGYDDPAAAITAACDEYARRYVREEK